MLFWSPCFGLSLAPWYINVGWETANWQVLESGINFARKWEIYENRHFKHTSDRDSDLHVLCFLVALALVFRSHPVTSNSVEKWPVDKFWKVVTKKSKILPSFQNLSIGGFSTDIDVTGCEWKAKARATKKHKTWWSLPRSEIWVTAAFVKISRFSVRWQKWHFIRA